MTELKVKRTKPYAQVTEDHCPAYVQFCVLKWIKFVDVMPLDAGLAPADVPCPTASWMLDVES